MDISSNSGRGRNPGGLLEFPCKTMQTKKRGKIEPPGKGGGTRLPRRSRNKDQPLLTQKNLPRYTGRESYVGTFKGAV